MAIVLLFMGGYALGRYAELGPIQTGLTTMSIGVVLFALTIALGGDAAERGGRVPLDRPGLPGRRAQRTRRFRAAREVSLGPMLGVAINRLEATFTSSMAGAPGRSPPCRWA